MDLLRTRLQEKDDLLEQKSKMALAAQLEKKKTEAEILDIQDQVDIKDRKISVLLRKVLKWCYTENDA